MATHVNPFPPFHLAFPVRDIEETRAFYVNALGCTVGREAKRWIDFDFFGHQISAHVREGELTHNPSNTVDGDAVPIRHFGCILDMNNWYQLRDQVTAYGVEFIVGPKVRFVGKPGEQATMFFCDPSGNALEFKAFADMNRIFAKQNDE